jgi:AraC family transcriptional regulator
VGGLFNSERFTFPHAGRFEMKSNENAFAQSFNSDIKQGSTNASTIVSAAKCQVRSDGLGVEKSDTCDNNDALASLLATATVALDTDCRAAKRCIQRAAVLLGIDLSPAGNGTAERSCLRGGLAPWQAKRLRSHIEDKLDSSIRATDLAGLVQLSTSHFFRAFRKTFGESPVTYIMKRRIRRAQQLMLTSRLRLAQVALECGMADQAHFSRVFRRIVGTNPDTWRRQFFVGPAPDGSAAGKSPSGQPDEPCYSTARLLWERFTSSTG